MSPAWTSSRTVVEPARSSSDAHSSWTAAAIWRRDLLLLAGPAGARRARAAGRRSRASLSTVVRRRASVGCAVRTSRTSASRERVGSSRGARAAGRQPRDRVAQRAAARRGASASSRARMRRTRSLSSARFMSWSACEHPHEQLELAQVEPGDELRELVGRGGVAARERRPSATARSMQLERAVPPPRR